MSDKQLEEIIERVIFPIYGAENWKQMPDSYDDHALVDHCTDCMKQAIEADRAERDAILEECREYFAYKIGRIDGCYKDPSDLYLKIKEALTPTED